MYVDIRLKKTISQDQFFGKMCKINVRPVSKRNLRVEKSFLTEFKSYSQILWTYRCVLYFIFLSFMNLGKRGAMVPRMWVWKTREIVFWYRPMQQNLYVHIHVGSGVNLFLYWLGTWNLFPGKTAAGELNSTHVTWRRVSKWEELIIYSTT